MRLPAAFAFVLAVMAAIPLRAAEPAPDPALAARVDAAFTYSFPLYEMARARWNAMVHPLNPAPSPVNGRPFHKRALIDHSDRDVTTPNNDTLYSATWLELSRSPVRMSLPKIDGGRYWSVALLDIWTNNFAILGREHDGEGPLEVIVVGPDWQGHPPAGRILRSPSNDVQVVVRILVADTADARVVHALQDAITIAPLDADRPPLPQWVPPTRSQDPENFLAVVNEMLARNPLPEAERAMVAGWRELGIGGGVDAWARTTPAVRAAWTARLPVLHERLRIGLRHGGREIGGWFVPAPAVGNFGEDYALRAAVAFGGLSALASTEAIYLNLETDGEGRALDGRKRYRLVVPAIAARGFWSLSMYEKDADGRLFFTANPLGRYSLGDRTPGIRREADGSLIVDLRHEAPTDQANWLPTPSGPMALTLRVYLPEEAMRRGEAPLPRLEAVGDRQARIP